MFEDEERINHIFEEFQKMDELYDEFKAEFAESMLMLIKETAPNFEISEHFSEQLGLYALSMLNVTHSLIDKDKTYTEIRMKDELLSMQTYSSKAVVLTTNAELADKTLQKTKELLLKFYPDIIDLSANGFRLLELNLRLFNLEFVANFNRLLEA